MQMLSYGGLMGLALMLSIVALSQADDFRPFNRKPTLAVDLVVVLSEGLNPEIAR